uniref:Thioredoxin domain-containing protein n=1 Tax=viral metagenome TaxID=1070528 RepID=A0A6C0EQ62_9ZZZZ
MSVIVYQFWSPTCTPCKAIKPSVDDLKEEFSQVTWVSVNTHDDNEGFATKYNVKVVPTIVVVSGSNVEKHSGTNIAGYYRIIRNGIRISQQS